MSDNSWIRPRSSYEKAAADIASEANTAAQKLYDDLKKKEVDFSDHGFEISKNDNVVSIKIGHMDIVRAVFGYGKSENHRVTDGVREACHEELFWDFDRSEIAAEKFKSHLSEAVDYFYKKQDVFRALGIV